MNQIHSEAAYSAPGSAVLRKLGVLPVHVVVLLNITTVWHGSLEAYGRSLSETIQQRAKNKAVALCHCSIWGKNCASDQNLNIAAGESGLPHQCLYSVCDLLASYIKCDKGLIFSICDISG